MSDERIQMGEVIYAPFTDQQVATLNRFQACGFFHPFTCGKRSEHPGEWPHRDEGILVAASEGWACPVPECDYTQSWVHACMASEEWVTAVIESYQRMWIGARESEA